MKLKSTGTVYASRRNTDGASAIFPQICVLPTGRWLAGFRLGPAKSSRTSRVYVAWSDDQGISWSQPRLVAQPMKVDGKEGCWRMGGCTPLGGNKVFITLAWDQTIDPLLPMYNESSEGLVDFKVFSALSTDGGETFSKPKRIDLGRYNDVPTPTTGSMLILANGDWAVQYEINKHYEDPKPWQHASTISISSDKGKTWPHVVDVHTDPKKRIFCWDQRLSVMPDGSVVDLFWTFDRVAAKYLNIHASVSKDHGRTWSRPRDLKVPGQPAPPVGLKDGSMVMVYVDREAQPTIKARLSRDGGKTFPDSTELIIHRRKAPTKATIKKGDMNDAWTEMGLFSIGLPATTLLPDGDILTVFYTGDSQDYTDIQWVRFAV